MTVAIPDELPLHTSRSTSAPGLSLHRLFISFGVLLW